MINRIKRLLGGPEGDTVLGGDSGGFDETQVAAAALLVEAARLDEQFDQSEWLEIRGMLCEKFGLTEEEAETLVATADAEVEGSAEIYRFARVIKDNFDHEDRIRIIEMLWRVVYADGVVHDFEANLLRRVAGLIYVSDRESGSARKRVLADLNVSG